MMRHMPTKAELESGQSALQSLVDADVAEALVQRAFEEHPVLLRAMNYDLAIPHPELRISDTEKYVPDFIARNRVTELWEIIELKRPDTLVLSNRTRRSEFYAEFRSYLSQCREYSQWFQEARNRKLFKRRYGIEMQREVRSLIVAGRSDGLDRRKVNDILLSDLARVSHVSFDDVVRTVNSIRLDTFGEIEGLPGLSIHLVVLVHRIPGASIQTVMDIGRDPARSRITVWIDHADNLCLSVMDRSGDGRMTLRLQRGDDGWDYERVEYLAIEIGWSDHQSVISLDLNGRCAKTSILEQRIEVSCSVEESVFGANLVGQHLSNTEWYEIAIYGRTLSFVEREELRAAYFDPKYQEAFINPDAVRRLQLTPPVFMRRDTHPNFDATTDAESGALIVGPDEFDPTSWTKRPVRLADQRFSRR